MIKKIIIANMMICMSIGAAEHNFHQLTQSIVPVALKMALGVTATYALVKGCLEIKKYSDEKKCLKEKIQEQCLTMLKDNVHYTYFNVDIENSSKIYQVKMVRQKLHEKGDGFLAHVIYNSSSTPYFFTKEQLNDFANQQNQIQLNKNKHTCSEQIAAHKNGRLYLESIRVNRDEQLREKVVAIKEAICSNEEKDVAYIQIAQADKTYQITVAKRKWDDDNPNVVITCDGLTKIIPFEQFLNKN